MAVVRGRKLYDWKWKILFETDQPGRLIQRFKDAPTFAGAPAAGKLPRRGAMKNQISAALFGLLQKNGIPTHFLEVLSARTCWFGASR